MERRLYRSRRERMIGGVAGGLGEYLGIDPVVIRLLFALLVVTTGWGVLLYIILLVVMPEEPERAPGQYAPEPRYHRLDANQRGMLVGGALVALGVLLLAKQLHLFWWLDGRYLLPLFLIAAGVALLIERTRSE